jgi:Lhr-like helicase
VFAGAGPGSGRVGELDEEMVFESRVGETFLLGASTWRIEEIATASYHLPWRAGQDAVLEGHSAGRPRARPRNRELARELREMPPPPRSISSSGNTTSIARRGRTCCNISPINLPPAASS